MNRLCRIFILPFFLVTIYLAANATSLIQRAYFEPFAVRDNLDSTKLVLYCDGENIEQLKIVLDWLVSDQNPIILRDDGTNGDELAKDHYFTRDNLLFNIGVSVYYTSVNFSSSEITYIYDDSTSEIGNLNLDLGLIVINANKVPIPDIKRAFIDSNIDNTDYVLAFNNRSTLDIEIAKTFYSYIEDNKDFLLIAYPFVRGAGIAGSSATISNKITGIGLNLFDYTSDYGSSNKLQGVISLFPGVALGLLNHEILHRWAVYLDVSLNLSYGAHWSALVANTSGFGFGSIISGGVYRQLEHVTGNMYRALLPEFSEETTYYNDIELYLMGLKDQTAIADTFESLIDPISLGYQNIGGIGYELFSASGISKTSIEDIIKIHGNRNPSSISSQKRFKIALIISCERSLTDVEFALYSYMMEEYEKTKSNAGLTFFAATSGLAEMNSRIISIDFSPQLFNPVQEAECHANNINFSWYKTNGSINYRFQLSKNENFTVKVIDALLSDTSIVINNFDKQSIYFWRVKAINNFGESYWSETRTLSILSAINPAISDYKVQFYPNPTTGVSKIYFPGNKTIKIEFWDVSGRKVEEINDYFNNGETRVDFSDWNSGLYIYRLIDSDGRIYSGRVIKE